MTNPPRKLTGRPAMHSPASRHPGRIAAAVVLAFAAAAPCARAESTAEAPAAAEQPADPLAEARKLLREAEENRDIPRITQLLEAAATAGSKEAKLLLAEGLYLGVEGFPRDPAAAEPYIRDLALAGVPWAQNTLGAMFEFGTVVEANRTSAIEWYQKAAMAGNARAMANLGRLLSSGPPAGQNEVLAIAWLQMASDRKEPMGTNLLKELLPGVPEARRLEVERVVKETEALIEERRKTKTEAPVR